MQAGTLGHHQPPERGWGLGGPGRLLGTAASRCPHPVFQRPEARHRLPSPATRPLHAPRGGVHPMLTPTPPKTLLPVAHLAAHAPPPAATAATCVPTLPHLPALSQPGREGALPDAWLRELSLQRPSTADGCRLGRDRAPARPHPRREPLRPVRDAQAGARPAPACSPSLRTIKLSPPPRAGPSVLTRWGMARERPAAQQRPLPGMEWAPGPGLRHCPIHSFWGSTLGSEACGDLGQGAHGGQGSALLLQNVCEASSLPGPMGTSGRPKQGALLACAPLRTSSASLREGSVDGQMGE